eukprot:m.254492 g.254492  ORF g.254492 m.254492 type:complete len:79 (+) comp17554_c0_seq6:546-782(+)
MELKLRETLLSQKMSLPGLKDGMELPLLTKLTSLGCEHKFGFSAAHILFPLSQCCRQGRSLMVVQSQSVILVLDSLLV